MLERMAKLIRDQDLIPPGSTVLCAVSGGADSVCLLHALYHLRPRLGFSLAAAHYNHHLRGAESEGDALFVEQLVALCCGEDRLPDGGTLPAVPLFSGGGDVATQAALRGAGVEETAREMRYAFLRQAARQAGATLIATAHNADDNAETVLFHLARGTGLRGLCGIPVNQGGLIRPLLSTPRREIEDYLNYYGLPWREDRTNADDAYARNRIRHQVMPVLEQLFPGFSSRLSGCTGHLREDEKLLSRQAALLSAQAVRKGDRLSLPVRLLSDAPPPLALRAARQLMGQLSGGDERFSASHLEGVTALCAAAGPSARLSLPRGVTARREYDLLVLAREETLPALPPTPLALPGETLAGPWRVTCTPAAYAGQPQRPFDFWLSARPAGALVLRPRAPGDRLRPPGRPEKTLKKWFIDEKIPRCRRGLLPVVDFSGRAAAVAGLGPDSAFLPQPGQAAWHLTFVPLPDPETDGGADPLSGKEEVPHA